MTADHLTDIEMAALAEGKRSARTVEQMQAHLASCDECRTLLVEVTRLTAGARGIGQTRLRQPAWRWLAAAAAASLAVALPFAYSTSGPREELSSVSSERARPGEADSVRTSMPRGVVKAAGEIRFAWEGEPDASYRVTISDATGGPVWETITSDTTFVLPPTVKLAGRATYYWYVDALRLDGSSITSGRRSFSTSWP